MKAKKRGNFSKYYLFDGSTSDFDNYDIKGTDDIEEYETNPLVQLRIQELRRWNKVFFSKQTLMKMNWFGGLKIDITQPFKDFDMILKLKNIKNSNNPTLVVFEMVDANNQSFFLQYSKENYFKVGNIMKIRSIIKL